MRCFKATLHLAAIAILCLARAESKEKRASANDGLIPNEDSQVSETGFAGAVAAGSKYFQYAHVPAKDHYEHGHKRGNEHHFIERHEKAHPGAGEFKTKVRWGDKHGGYGEHFYDYNHAGHGGHDGEGEESAHHEQYAEIAEEPNQHQINSYNRKKRQPAPGSIDGDVEFINTNAQFAALTGIAPKHGGNYRAVPGAERAKRNHQQRAAPVASYAPNHKEDDKAYAPFGWQPVQFKF